MQTFVPYGSPYTLPIPANATPSAVTTAPGVNYPDVSGGGLTTLANATSDFALRFVGENPVMVADASRLARACRTVQPEAAVLCTCELFRDPAAACRAFAQLQGDCLAASAPCHVHVGMCVFVSSAVGTPWQTRLDFRCCQ